jgi:hypothetical protein
MKFTNLNVTKIGRNEFYIEVQECISRAGLLRNTRKWSTYVSSIADAQSVLSLFPNRDCQRIGTSTRVAHRFRSARTGDLCFTVRWDGGAGSVPGPLYPEIRKNPRKVAWDLVPFSFSLDDILARVRAGGKSPDVNEGEG